MKIQFGQHIHIQDWEYTSEWSTCSVTCGIGTKSREQSCLTGEGTPNDPSECGGTEEDTTLTSQCFLQRYCAGIDRQWNVRDWKVSECIFLQNWKVSESESVRIGKCQNWKVSELESVRIGKYTFQFLPKWAKIGFWHFPILTLSNPPEMFLEIAGLLSQQQFDQPINKFHS